MLVTPSGNLESPRWDKLATDRTIPPALAQLAQQLTVGMSREEQAWLYEFAHDLPMGSTVLHIGVWRGASVILLMAGGTDSQHIGIDGFDLPGVSKNSANVAVTMQVAAENCAPFIMSGQSLKLMRADTRDLSGFPRANFIVIDAGHTLECIDNDLGKATAALEPGGTLICHDYGNACWPAVKIAIDRRWPWGVGNPVGTLAVIQPI